MKPIKSLLLCAGFLFCVACDQDVLTDLQSQINALKSNQIASIEAQVSNINASLTALEATDTELKGYIATLQEQQAALAQENSNLAEIITVTKKDLQDSIGTVQADLLAQLEAYKQTVSGQLALIDASIATLTEKDTALDAQIAALREYTDGEIQKTKDWASATFVTLEKYNETVALVTTIQQQIAAINTRMDTFQNDLTTLSTQLAGLREDHLKAIQDNAAALATAVTNITNAYTEAIATAITTSETSLKNWVAAELTAYYTAAQTDEKLEALQAEQDQKLNQQKAYVEALLTNLQTVLEGKISTNTELINGLQGQINNLSAEAAQLAKSILDNADSIAVNSTKIKENAQAISQNSTDITTCGSLIAANKTLIQDNAKAIAANDTAILTLQASVATNEQGISNNVINIAKNAADIAVNAGLIAANATAISNNTTAISDNATAITQLQTDLQTAIADLTESYNSAIQTAITTLDGKLTGEIATQISTVNTRIDTEVAAINSAITALTARVEACETDIAAIRSDIAAIRADIEALQTTVASLLARIQSISYVPKYSDSKAVMTFTNNGSLAPGFAELTFKIQPASAATTLAEVWQTALKVESVLAETRTAPETVNLPIQSVSADSGYLTVFVGGTGLSENYFTGTKSAFVALVVSDGNNNRTSEYVNIIPEVAITIEEAANITPVSASIRGALGKETAFRITDPIVLYYSATETDIAGLVANGQHQDMTPTANGSFGISLQQLETGAMYRFVAAVKDCGEWFYSAVKTFSTLNYTAEAVDMGLPSGLKWSAYNLGASSPEESGAYFAWGETEPKANYSWSTYKWCNGTSSTLTKYSKNETTELVPEDDAATIKLGGLWRMPTREEADELQSYCSSKDTIINGITGKLFTSRTNQAKLFFPNKLGYYSGSDIIVKTTSGGNGGFNYWSRDRSISDIDAQTKAQQLWTYTGITRCSGMPIRPVQDIDWEQVPLSLTTLPPTEISPITANLRGSFICAEEGFFANKAGFLYSETASTLEDLKSRGKKASATIEDGDISGCVTLKPGLNYYYVVCATVRKKEFYGEVQSFRTYTWEEIFSFATLAPTNSVGVSVTMNGELDILNKSFSADSVGFLYSTSASTLQDIINQISSQSQATILRATISDNTFSSRVSGLLDETTYHYVAYVSIAGRVHYGEMQSFTTGRVVAPSAIDMGVSVQWGEFNIGASQPEEFGSYYSWGETSSKTRYDESTYKWWDGSWYTKYTRDYDAGYGVLGDGRTILEKEDDAATVLLGNKWRMPTAAEWNELMSNCTSAPTILNGINGYRLVSKTTGNTLFIPSAFLKSKWGYSSSWRDGNYWASTLVSSGSANRFSFGSTGYNTNDAYDRTEGLSIRPVKDYDWNEIISIETLPFSETSFNGRVVVSNPDFVVDCVWFIFSSTATTLEDLKQSGDTLSAKLSEESFSYKASFLTSATKYYYVACCRVRNKTFFGDVQSFTAD